MARARAPPQYLNLVGEVPMGRAPGLSVGIGQCARINTGGMLPYGADAVVMLEHTRLLDDETVEVVKSVAPGANLMGPTDDARAGSDAPARRPDPAPPRIWASWPPWASCAQRWWHGPRWASSPPATRWCPTGTEARTRAGAGREHHHPLRPGTPSRGRASLPGPGAGFRSALKAAVEASLNQKQP